MMLSSNEISGLVLKAGRGAGVPLGFAEALAEVAPALARAGHIDRVVAALAETGDRPSIERHTGIATISGGTALARIMALLDFLRSGRSVRTALGDTQVLAQAMADARGLKLVCAEGIWSAQSVQAANVQAGPVEIPQSYLDQLHSHAAKTLVPETAQSRLSGAGAGLTDND